MATEIIPAVDTGSFVVTEKMLVESGAATLGAFEVLVLAEAEKRKLLITTTRDVASGGIRVSWHPERVGEGNSNDPQK